MSLSAQFDASIVRDDAMPEIERLVKEAGPERSAKICRDPLRGFWRDHLKHYPRLPGKFFAFPATGFGEEAADSVEGFAQDGAVRLTASKQGLRLRYTGGTIRPVNKKALCFPITPEAYAGRPTNSAWVSSVAKTPNCANGCGRISPSPSKSRSAPIRPSCPRVKTSRPLPGPPSSRSLAA